MAAFAVVLMPKEHRYICMKLPPLQNVLLPLTSFMFRGLGGLVEWCEDVVYFTLPGRPADIGLQLGKACYPCSR